MKCFSCIVASALAITVGCAPKKTDPPPHPQPPLPTADAGTVQEQQTLRRLRLFSAGVQQSGGNDEWILRELGKLNQSLANNDLPIVEQFSTSGEGSGVAWALARLLVERGRLNGAADAIVTSLTGESTDDPRTAVWKWWEFNFKERSDFDDLTHRMGEAFYRQFLLGTSARRRVVALIFSLMPDDSQLSPEEFHKKAFDHAP